MSLKVTASKAAAGLSLSVTVLAVLFVAGCNDTSKAPPPPPVSEDCDAGDVLEFDEDCWGSPATTRPARTSATTTVKRATTTTTKVVPTTRKTRTSG